MKLIEHQYIERSTQKIKNERLLFDKTINFLYSSSKEESNRFFNALTNRRMSSLLGFLHYDSNPILRKKSILKYTDKIGIDISECIDPPEFFTSKRKIFERKIKYWETRPMSDNPCEIVSPADAKAIVGSFDETSIVFIKEKFFHFDELLGEDKTAWLEAFYKGNFAIFRLTPEKYHYNHTPVSGKVIDVYEIEGQFHSCNPSAVISVVTPYSKNKRVITIIDTDVENGSNVGLVAMIEIVALMIGDIVQCYSEFKYDSPVNVALGLFLKKGQPKSLYRPGSSTDVLIFQKDRIKFSNDLLANRLRHDVKSRFSIGFSTPLVETDLKLRATIGKAIK
ncbi:MAG: phosphatidylserine decarboxylase [Desulfobacterales bacterium]|nr:phosphatidylserine decarboxylase [Desulfobacterales bacterium]